MKKFSILKGRIREYADNKGISVKEIYSKTGISDGTFSNSSGLNEENILKFFSYYSDINIEWLFTGNGDMINDNRHLEQENWITSDNNHESKKFSDAALKRIGLRLDELVSELKINHDTFIDIIGIDRLEFYKIVGGKLPATENLLNSILVNYPNINPLWLYLGKGEILNKHSYLNEKINEIEKINAMQDKVIQAQEKAIKLLEDNLLRVTPNIATSNPTVAEKLNPQRT